MMRGNTIGENEVWQCSPFSLPLLSDNARTRQQEKMVVQKLGSARKPKLTFQRGLRRRECPRFCLPLAGIFPKTRLQVERGEKALEMTIYSSYRIVGRSISLVYLYFSL